MIDVTMRVPAIEKLADYAASGIGSIAGPMLATWRARREAEAKRIAAQGDADALAIRAEGQAGALPVIAEAQGSARRQLAAPGVSVEGELTIADEVEQRVRFQEEKRQRNISAIVSQAAEQITADEVEDQEPDHDWTARFFNEAQDVSSEEMQSLWAKVLAGEVERPGSTSIQTLNILRNLDQKTAALFRKLCSLSVSIKSDKDVFIDSRAPSLVGAQEGNALRKYGLDFGSLNVLNEHGLIISEYNSWHDFNACIDIHASEPKQGNLFVLPFIFQGKYWILIPLNPRDHNKEFRLSGVALTRSGQEISRIIDLEPMDEYAQDLLKFFREKSLQMTEVDSPLVRVV